MDPDEDDGQLKGAGRFQRLDLMIATNLIDKFNNMRKSRYQLGHHTHFLQQITRAEFNAQAEGRLMTGREMVRAICHWCSVRSELGQHRISRDLFRVIIDPREPDADLYHFYSAWTDVYQQLYGAKPPSDEMRASIHARFLEQCRKPSKLNFA
eukprot:6326119-Pyramimonas_sp.AAC.1